MLLDLRRRMIILRTGQDVEEVLGTTNSPYKMEERKKIFSTGVQYHQFGSLCLLAASAVPGLSKRGRNIACVGVSLGTLMFAGSTYAVALSGDRKFSYPAPVGGLFMMGSLIAGAVV